MSRSRGAMLPLPARGLLALPGALLAALLLASSARAGPLPSNVTITEGGLQPESSSCALGDVVYMSGDEFPGAEPCERCACAGGRVSCARQECAPRPGCKAVHRPDHCCPTYQCECEQEGRVYGNGEKLVDPADPCRVCYCQGGEVVCRRIACFVRDDCRPRLVPGRCCPEYDNCPLRGAHTAASMPPSNMPIEDVGTTPPPAPAAPPKQEITIKEITPVSEIPVITDVKIKEILPSPSVEVAEYPSSKSPLIPREATSEKSFSSEEELLTSSFAPSTSAPEATSTSHAVETKSTDELYPSKISFSTQDAINSDIYPSDVPSVSSSSAPSKAPLFEEEDTSLFEHNPAFPPLPDDLSVLASHDDELAPEPLDDHNEHVTVAHEVKAASTTAPTTAALTTTAPTTVAPTTAAPTTVAPTSAAPTTVAPTTTAPTTEAPRQPTTTEASATTTEVPAPRVEPVPAATDNAAKTEMFPTKVSPMLNLRSALPTEILSIPSSVHEVITGELDEDEASTSTAKEPTTAETSTSTITTTTTTITTTTTTTTPQPTPKIDEQTTQTTKSPLVVETTKATKDKAPFVVSSSADPSTAEVTELRAVTASGATSHSPKADLATDVTSLTELSSLPVETSDQHPPAPTDERPSTAPPLAAPTSIKMASTEAEAITVSRAETQTFDNVETTEFILSSLGSSESTTDAVELIKISSEPEKSAAIVDSSGGKKTNIFTDLINLVGDVASMGDSTEEPRTANSIADSEELIPVNAGYKSKNNNFNVNSITESPLKSKAPAAGGKQKVVELESEDDAGITDGAQRAEPTTRRAVIDRVGDTADQPTRGAPAAPAGDIEIITRSYVPTINRRPTKVVMKKSEAEPAASAEVSTDEPAGEPAHAP